MTVIKTLIHYESHANCLKTMYVSIYVYYLSLQIKKIYVCIYMYVSTYARMYVLKEVLELSKYIRTYVHTTNLCLHYACTGRPL